MADVHASTFSETYWNLMVANKVVLAITKGGRGIVVIQKQRSGGGWRDRVPPQIPGAGKGEKEGFIPGASIGSMVLQTP